MLQEISYQRRRQCSAEERGCLWTVQTERSEKHIGQGVSPAKFGMVHSALALIEPSADRDISLRHLIEAYLDT